VRNQKWDVKLVGALAEEHEVEGRSAMFINNNNTIQFFIKIISYEPNDFPREVKAVTCFSNELEKWGFEDDLSIFDDKVRSSRVKDFLKDSLLVFQPELRFGTGFKEYYIATNVNLIAKNESFKPDISLIPIPLYQVEEGMDEIDFEVKLIGSKYVGNNQHISRQDGDTPSFIVLKNDHGDFNIYGEFESHAHAHGGFRFISESDKVHKLKIRSSWRGEIYMWDTIWFFPSEIHDEIIEQLGTAEILTISDQDLNIKERIEETQKADEEVNKEEQFLQDLTDKTRESGLFYSKEDLYKFHVAMKTQSLVILAGMSGTGKSQLVSAYAKALGLSASQVNIMPVRPSWTDDTDLIGYPDTLNNVYRPGDSGLVNTLLKAENEKESLFIICFDEMNLARVEHYFSQFLSVLEMDNKQLKLYNEDLQHRFYNGEQYSPKVAIRDNVIFVGTVNIDETTHHFSDKVLDRANVIELQILPYENLLEIEEKKESKPRDKVITAEEYTTFRKNSRSVELSRDELRFMWAIHESLQDISSSMGIGPRVVRQIDRYIRNIPKSSPFTRQEAIDIQIVQRVLTKVRGSDDLLLPLLGSYHESEDTVVESRLYDIFDEYESVSEFIRSRQLIIQKAKELVRNGYTI
jgi:MoxR-like ATPase